MKREFKTIVIIFMFIFLFELFYSVFLYKHFTFYIFSFTLLYSLIIYLLYKIFNKKWIIYICFSIILLMFLSNFVYYSLYNNIITLDVFLKSFSVLSFGKNILNIIFNNIFYLLCFIIIFITSIILINKNTYDFVINKTKLICIILIVYIISMSMILIDNKDIYSNKKLYFNMNYTSKTLYNYGLLTSIRLDTEKYLFGYNSCTSKIKVNNNAYSKDEYNILNTKFKKSDNSEINEINDYIKNSIPSNKNIYTGVLKDKNLIFILAESFNTISINKEITPNLYRLFSEGFTFNNYYNPLYPVSTADGQYLTDISLFPSDAVHSLQKVNNNYIPYSLGNVFKSMNYITYSFHDYDYKYYGRDKYYPNMGYDTFLGVGNGLMKDTRSDYDMAKSSINYYINDSKFLVYYLTISGHALYNSDNKIAKKNYDKLKNYNYSDSVKYYMSTQIELDKMIGYLFLSLEKKGILDDTVIVLLPDHIPYGLNEKEMNELSKYNVFDEFEKYHSSMVIYNKEINKYHQSNNYCSNIDMLPTLLNLFGYDFDSRLLMGRDILSGSDGYAVFGNRNVISRDYRYISLDGIFEGKSNISSDELKNEIYLKHRISRLILENDYYKYLWEVNSD